ncbi:hypothetical protein [Cupriavidus sp. CP313]
MQLHFGTPMPFEWGRPSHWFGAVSFEGDTVSFDFETTEAGYRNVIKETLITKDKAGKVVVRGERGEKPWRTATTRLPGSRRKQRD